MQKPPTICIKLKCFIRALEFFSYFYFATVSFALKANNRTEFILKFFLSYNVVNLIHAFKIHVRPALKYY